VGKKEPIDAVQGVVERRRHIEVHGGERNTGWQASGIRLSGQRHQVDRFRNQACDQGESDATCSAGDGYPGAAGVGLSRLEHLSILIYLGTTSPRYLERSFQDVKREYDERKAAV
jgi:hypothetical protein